MGGRHPRSGDAAAGASVCPHRPLRPVRVAAHLCAARPLHLHGARADRRAAVGGLRRARRRLLSALHGRPAGARAVHRRALCRHHAAGRQQRPRARHRRDHPHLGGPADGCHRRIGRRPRAAREARKQVSRGLFPGLRRDVRAGAGAGGHQAHRAAGAGPAGRRRLLQRAGRPGARGDVPVRPAHAAVRARADPGKPRLLRHRRAHLPRHATLQRRHARGRPCTTWRWR